MESVIKILREQNRYTQTKLSEVLGISRPALINYENLEQDLPISVVKALSKLFNISYECLIDNKLPNTEDEKDKEALTNICNWYPKLKKSEKYAVYEMVRIMSSEHTSFPE